MKNRFVQTKTDGFLKQMAYLQKIMNYANEDDYEQFPSMDTAVLTSDNIQPSLVEQKKLSELHAFLFIGSTRLENTALMLHMYNLYVQTVRQIVINTNRILLTTQ